MAYTDSTTHYQLPQYVATDRPTYLNDFNTAMSAIDTAIYNAYQLADTANTTATQASGDASTALSTAQSASSTASQASTDASTALSTAQTASTTATSANTQANTNHNILASFFQGFTGMDNWTPSNS